MREESEGCLAPLPAQGWAVEPSHLVMSTVVTLNLTPLSHSTMKRRWQKGQFPMFSPSRPACRESRETRL